MDATKSTKPRRAGRGFASANACGKAGLAYSIATVLAIVALPFLPAIYDRAGAVFRFVFGGLL